MTETSDVMPGHRILVALDESPASQRAVEYVGQMVRGRPDHYVHLVHVLSAAPGQDPQPAREQAHRVLEGMGQSLRSAGVEDEQVDVGVLEVPPDSSMVTGLLDLARDQSAQTIVVGRNSLPQPRDLVHRHPADELVRKAAGFTLWVVE